MKPRNKFDSYCLELSRKLDNKPISQTHVNFGAKANFWNYYTTHYSKKICLECSHTFKAEPRNDKGKTVDCPSCNKTLHHTHYFHVRGYFSILTTIEDCQVERVFCIDKDMDKKKPSEIHYSEVVRKFINPQGKYCVLAKKSGGMFGSVTYYDSDFEVKDKRTNAANPYTCMETIFPKKRFIPELIRNGYQYGMFKAKDNTEGMRLLLKNNFFEWLIKANQPKFANYYFTNSKGKRVLPQYKTQLKAIFKKGIEVNPSDYVDYIDLLIHFGKDIQNPKYSCPENFHQEHQHYVRKHAKIEAKKDAQRQKEYMEHETEIYQQKKAKYLNFSIQNEDIQLTVPKHVKEFHEAGQVLKHCIYSNEYWKKQTIILFAIVNGELIETAEVDPKEKKIIQCRGYDNEPTEQHDKIVNLIQSN